MNKKFFAIFIKVIDYLTQSMLMLFTITIFVNMVGRYFFLRTILWSEQISRFLFIWMCFLGIFMVTVRRQHLMVDVMVSRFPRVAKNLVIVSGNILSIIFLSLLGISGVVILPYIQQHVDPPLMVPLGYVFIIIPICSFLTVMSIIGQTYSLVCSLATRRQRSITKKEGEYD